MTVLHVEPLSVIKEREKSRVQATKVFLRRHASVIKKNLLIASLNHKLVEEQLRSQRISPTEVL